MVCAMGNFKNAGEDNDEEWLQSDMRELGFQYMIGTDIANAATK
jgi:hypothetical protein